MGDADTVAVNDLAQVIANYRGVTRKPYVLVLGAGVSMPAGLPSSTELIDRVLADDSSITPVPVTSADKWEHFQRRWNTVGHERQATYLESMLTGIRDARGLGCLADLIADGHFDYVFTTNIDTLLEARVIRAGRSVEFTVTYAYAMRDDIVRGVLSRSSGLHLIKMHGDLNHREWAFSTREIYRFTGSLQRDIEGFLRDKDIILVGHSLHDEDVLEWVSHPQSLAGRRLWWVNPHSMDADIRSELEKRRKVIPVAFGADDFFCSLKDALGNTGLDVPPTASTPLPGPTATEPPPGAQSADFYAPPPLPFQLVMGVADYFAQGSLGLGSPESHSIARWLIQPPTQFELRTRFKVVNQGEDESDWVGVMVDAKNPYLGGGWLCYIRLDGRLEIYSPQMEIVDHIQTNIDPRQEDIELVIRRKVSGISGLLEAEIPNRAVVKAQIPVIVLDIGFGELITLHAFRLNARFTNLSIQPLVSQ